MMTVEGEHLFELLLHRGALHGAQASTGVHFMCTPKRKVHP